MTPLIVCPTHGRAGNVKTFDVLPDIPLCVAESQKPLYEEHYPDVEYIVHPDDVRGISPKRQWLIDRYGDVFMVDDDVTAFFDLSVGPGNNPVISDPQFVRDCVERLFDTAEQIGAYLVGFSRYADATLYRPQIPFKLVGFLSGHAIGFRKGSKLWFPDTTELLTDDLYISALNAHHHRFMWQDNRYSFVNPDVWRNKGGMATDRTMARLGKNADTMVELFGDAIRFKKQGDSQRAGLRHDLQLTLDIPWG